MRSARRSPTSWASRLPLSNAPCCTVRRLLVAEEGEGFLRNRSDEAAACRACPGCRTTTRNRLAARPVLAASSSRPLRDERRFPFAAEGDEGEDVGARRLERGGLQSQASSRISVSASRPMSSAGAYLMMREMSALKPPHATPGISADKLAEFRLVLKK